jgi:hypothetical protein
MFKLLPWLDMSSAFSERMNMRVPTAASAVKLVIADAANLGSFAGT